MNKANKQLKNIIQNNKLKKILKKIKILNKKINLIIIMNNNVNVKMKFYKKNNCNNKK